MNSVSYDKPLRESLSIRIIGFVLSFLVAGGILYSNTLRELLSAVLERKGSSHGVFVPLLSLFFMWRKRFNLRGIEPKYVIVPGLVAVAVGLLLYSLARANSYFYWECVSFIVVLAGLVICFLGKDLFKEISFPIFFLISMIPIPWNIYMLLGNWVKSIALELSTDVLAFTGVPFLREESLLHLPNLTLNVTPGCSGIRYLLSYFVFGMAYAYLYRTKTNQRIVLVGLTIPISLLASTLRLTSIALLSYYIGPHMAEYWPHVITSWLVFLSVLVFFVGLDRRILSSLAERTENTEDTKY